MRITTHCIGTTISSPHGGYTNSRNIHDISMLCHAFGVVEVYLNAFWFSITVYTHTLQIQYDNKCMIMYSMYAHRMWS